MQVYIFRSVKVTDVFGFTEDEAGRNLPPEFSPWSRQGEAQAIRAGGGPGAAADGDAIRRALRIKGYALTRAGLTVARSGQSRCRDARCVVPG
jgi:hypothetical protein